MTDRVKMGKRKDSIVLLLMLSIFSVFVCFICVCGMTWAWYSVNIESPTQKISAAYYEVTVESVKIHDGEEKMPVNGIYHFEADIAYTIILRTSGSVKECDGYCLIECGNVKYYTQTMKPNQKFTITLTPTVSGAYTFTGVWGSIPSGVAEDEIMEANTEDTSPNTTDDPDKTP